MIIKKLHGHTPSYGKGCFFAENAVLVGDVTMGDQCSIWYGAVLRGDVHSIRLGNKVNIQDGAVVHCTYKKYPTNIGSNVTVGHNAVVHGCTIEDNVLIGMGAVVLDDCIVESNSIVAAGAVVTQGTRVEENSIYAGIPAKKVKDLSGTDMAAKISDMAENYVTYIKWYKETE